MTHKDLDGCVTKEELERLFDSAFAEWKPGRSDPHGHRQTPRIPAEGARPLFVSSYTENGREFPLNERARIVDVSADGLGLLIDSSLPVGASICLEFSCDSGETSEGVAEIVRVAKSERGFSIGVAFVEAARSLDISDTCTESGEFSRTDPAWQRVLDRVLDTVGFACSVIRRHSRASRTITRAIRGRIGVFVVEAKLFRYQATLFVDGRKTTSQSGVLRDRLRNLMGYKGLPTMIHLESAGFSAWATLRANEVSSCSLDPDYGVTREICSHALSAASAPAAIT